MARTIRKTSLLLACFILIIFGVCVFNDGEDYDRFLLDFIRLNALVTFAFDASTTAFDSLTVPSLTIEPSRFAA